MGSCIVFICVLLSLGLSLWVVKDVQSNGFTRNDVWAALAILVTIIIGILALPSAPEQGNSMIPTVTPLVPAPSPSEIGMTESRPTETAPVPSTATTETNLEIPTPLPSVPSPTPVTNISPSPTVAITPISLEEILPNIISGQDGIEAAAPWWRASNFTSKEGDQDPVASPPEGRYCFGVAWEVEEHERTIIVFQKAMYVDLKPLGGAYNRICVPNSIQISPEQVGAIQAQWNELMYPGGWKVEVIR